MTTATGQTQALDILGVALRSLEAAIKVPVKELPMKTNTESVNQQRQSILDAFQYAFDCAEKGLTEITFNSFILTPQSYEFAFNAMITMKTEAYECGINTDLQVQEICEGFDNDSFVLIYFDQEGTPIEPVCVMQQKPKQQ